MGTWGAGNFESDGALDYLDSVFNQFIKIIQDFLEFKEPEDTATNLSYPGKFELLNRRVIPTIDILITLCKQYNGKWYFEKYSVNEWKSYCLMTFDEEIIDYTAKPEYVVKRRQVIEETFDILIDLIK